MAQFLIGTQTTNSDGVAAFANLPDGNYRYVQVSAPQGYQLDPQAYSVTVSGGTVTVTATNVPLETGSLTVQKRAMDGAAQPVAGATFTLTCDGKTMLAESLPTDAGGSVTFSNLMSISGSPQSYSVREVTPPPGYFPNGGTYTAAVTAGAATAQNVPGLAQGSNTLNVELNDANYQALGLSGASYDVYYTAD